MSATPCIVGSSLTIAPAATVSIRPACFPSVGLNLIPKAYGKNGDRRARPPRNGRPDSRTGRPVPRGSRLAAPDGERRNRRRVRGGLLQVPRPLLTRAAGFIADGREPRVSG